MALPPLELPPIGKGRPVAGRPFCLVEKRCGIETSVDCRERFQVLSSAGVGVCWMMRRNSESIAKRGREILRLS